MKKLQSLVILTITLMMACQQKTSVQVDDTRQTQDSTGVVLDSVPYNTNRTVQEDPLVKDVLGRYIALKNALAADNAKEASSNGQQLVIALDSMSITSVSAEKISEAKEIIGDAREHAEHIGDNASNIKHQREHFQDLSTDMYDLLKLVGTSQKVYKDSCPMVKAIWISEKEEIANPFYGNKMLTCGKVIETIE